VGASPCLQPEVLKDSFQEGEEAVEEAHPSQAWAEGEEEGEAY
jgi:hypothetical protein